MKRILFVDDETMILDGLQRVLRPHRRRWNVTFAVGAPAGLALLEQQSFDIVVSDMRMPGMDGATFLEAVAARWPATVRLVLSGQTDAASAMRAAQVAHQFLTKPCESATLERVLARADSLHELITTPQLAALLGKLDQLPSLPGIQDQLTAVLGDPAVGPREVAAVVSRDPALAATVLQLVNSSFFGHSQEMPGVERAVEMLGTQLIQSLIAARGVFRLAEESSPSPWFDGEAEQRHAHMVADLARRLVPDPAQADAAFAAGLLHDIGRLVLALRAPEAYAAAVAMAEADRIPMVVAEETVLGTTHAEVGAYLLGIRGLPWPIVSAVRWHHAPEEGLDADLASFVWAADVLLDELEARPGQRGAADLEQLLVDRAGSVTTLATWRGLARETWVLG